MGVIDRYFRLTNEPGGLGLSCTESGLSLAGVPLLHKSEAGFAPRPPDEIDSLVRAAYGAGVGVGADDLLPGFDAVARALNRGELGHAMIAAVLTRLPELSWNDAARLANAEDRLRKYNPAEPRDEHGCWTSDGGVGASGQDRLPGYPVDFGPEDDDAEPPDDRSPLERKYDDLGPVEFAKQVLLFGDGLEREGKGFTPEEQQNARAEYNFLQDRLSFWLGHDNKPLEAQANLISAALSLYQGAVLSGIVPVGGERGDIPQSMVVAAAGAIALDDSQPGLPVRSRSTGSALDSGSTEPEEQTPAGQLRGEQLTPYDDLGGVADNAQVQIKWGGDIKAAGKQWEGYIAAENPDARVLQTDTKTFDLFYEPSGKAISAKSLDPLCYGYINNPKRVYYTIKRYVNAAANYDKTRAWFDLDPTIIESRTVRLGVRDYITPSQWQQLNRVVLYGKSRGVSVVVTRIRD